MTDDLAGCSPQDFGQQQGKLGFFFFFFFLQRRKSKLLFLTFRLKRTGPVLKSVVRRLLKQVLELDGINEGLLLQKQKETVQIGQATTANGRACDRPSIGRTERTHELGRLGSGSLDHLGLVQADTPEMDHSLATEGGEGEGEGEKT